MFTKTACPLTDDDCDYVVPEDGEQESPRSTTPTVMMAREKRIVGRLARTRYGYLFGRRVMATNVRLLCHFPLTLPGPLFG
jgi:hypothetical protein